MAPVHVRRRKSCCLAAHESGGRHRTPAVASLGNRWHFRVATTANPGTLAERCCDAHGISDSVRTSAIGLFLRTSRGLVFGLPDDGPTSMVEATVRIWRTSTRFTSGAVQLLPTISTLSDSTRTAPPMEFLSDFSLQPQELLRWINPFVWDGGQYNHLKAGFNFDIYCGGIVTLLLFV